MAHGSMALTPAKVATRLQIHAPTHPPAPPHKVLHAGRTFAAIARHARHDIVRQITRSASREGHVVVDLVPAQPMLEGRDVGLAVQAPTRATLVDDPCLPFGSASSLCLGLTRLGSNDDVGPAGVGGSRVGAAEATREETHVCGVVTMTVQAGEWESEGDRDCPRRLFLQSFALLLGQQPQLGRAHHQQRTTAQRRQRLVHPRVQQLSIL